MGRINKDLYDQYKKLSFDGKINYKKVKEFMGDYKENIKSYSALRKILEKLLSYWKKMKQPTYSFEEQWINEFISWVRYQEGRNNGLLNNKCCYLSELIESVWEEKKNYDDLKSWLQIIIANYVYYKWTKD